MCYDKQTLALKLASHHDGAPTVLSPLDALVASPQAAEVGLLVTLVDGVDLALARQAHATVRAKDKVRGFACLDLSLFHIRINA